MNDGMNAMVLFEPLPPMLPMPEWWQRFSALDTIERLTPWALARMLLYAKDNYCADNAAWQQFLADVADASGKAKHTLENYCSVARQWPYGSEYEELSFAHHAEVSGRGFSDEERDYWLSEAIRQGWSVEALRAALRGDRETQQRQAQELRRILSSGGTWQLSAISGGWIRLRNDNQEIDCKIAEWRFEQ